MNYPTAHAHHEQGVVHWPPPPEAMQAVVEALSALSQYGANEGLPALRDSLQRKVAEVNGLCG